VGWAVVYHGSTQKNKNRKYTEPDHTPYLKTQIHLAGGVGRCAVGVWCWGSGRARGTRGVGWELRGPVRVAYARKNTLSTL